MFCIKKNKKNKSAVILNPERSEWVSRSHVTSVEIVVNDGVKTKCYSAKGDLYGDFAYAQPLKMTDNSLSLSGASSEPIISAEYKRNQAMSLRGRAVGSDVVIFHAETEKALSFLRLCCTNEKRKKSSLILRKAKFQAIFKFVLSSASGGAGGGKYNRISAFVSMPVLLIRRSLEKIFKKIFRDDSFTFGCAKVKTLSFLRLRGASGAQGISATASCREAHKRRFILNPWILHFTNASLRMTIPMLAFLISLNISTSWAAKCIGSTGQWDDGSGSCSTCGTDCDWELVPVVDENKQPVYVSGTTNQAQTLNITGSGAMRDFKYNTTPWFNQRYKITSANITGVSSVGNYSFYGSTSLTSVDMPNVTTIGDSAFRETSLTSVDMPNVTTIRDSAFAYLTSLENVSMPNVETIGIGAFVNATSLTYVDMPNVETIGVQAFNGDEALEYIGLPDTGVTIKEGAFSSIVGGMYVALPIMSSCDSSSGYQVCTICESGQVYKQGSGCVSASECGEGYTDNGHGLCKKNPTQVAQNTTPQGGSGDTGGTSTGGDVSGDFNPSDCYNNGQVPYDNKCWDEYPFAKKRWTPAEANQWLHDGNDNFVVITFKK